MRHRSPTAALTLALSLSLSMALGACGSDDDATNITADPSAETQPADTQPADAGAADADTTDAADSGDADSGDADTAMADMAMASVVIEADGITADRPVRRGQQSETEQGQTFAVTDDATLTEVTFRVSAPDGVVAGQTVVLSVYEVGNPVAMVPSGPVDLGDGANTVVLSLEDGIDAGSSTDLVFPLAGVALSPGQYAVVLAFGDGSGPAEMFLQHPDGDVYADGVAISLEGEFWKSDTNGHDAAVTLTFDA